MSEKVKLYRELFEKWDKIVDEKNWLAKLEPINKEMVCLANKMNHQELAEIYKLQNENYQKRIK